MNPDDILRMARDAERWATKQTSDTYEWRLLRDERFAALVAAVVRNEVGSPGTGPVAFGSFAYAAGSPAGATLVVPRVLVGRRGDRAGWRHGWTDRQN